MSHFVSLALKQLYILLLLGLFRGVGLARVAFKGFQLTDIPDNMIIFWMDVLSTVCVVGHPNQTV